MSFFKNDSFALIVLAIFFVSGCNSSGDASQTDPAFVAKGQLNDTGLLACAGEMDVELPCPQSALPGQDAQFGRDALAQTGRLAKQGGGIGGFDWTKLDSAGRPLNHQQLAWQNPGDELEGTRWTCVLDQVTGLMWEVKESHETHPRFAGHTYTWWSNQADLNGGFIERFEGASCGTPDCTTQGYVEWLNSEGLCGFYDWRLPTVRELSSIAVLSQVIPAVDTNFFPNTLQPRFFTRDTLARDPSRAWYVYFSDGSVSFTNKSDASQVRLVRGGRS